MFSNELSLDSITSELNSITQSIAGLERGSPEAELALGKLFRAVQKFNYLSQTQTAPSARSLDSGVQGPPAATDTGILEDFDIWVQKFKDALDQIAKVLAASQYTIGVQFPFTIAVSITFVP